MAYICYQGNDRDCGFAALKMMLANKTENKSYLFIKKPSKKKDYSFGDLTRIARSYGFNLSGYYMPPEDCHDIPKGCIALLKTNHMVYIKRVGKRQITFYDPAIGKRAMRNDEFAMQWSGKLLECTNTRNAKEIKCRPVRMTPFWMDLIHYVMLAVIFTSLMMGFYLINDNTNILFTLGFLLLFALTELVENWYILKELKYFDNRFLGHYFSRKSNQSKERYKDYWDYKKNHFIVSKLLISNMIMVLVFSILLCINDYRNVFVFLILVLLKMIDNIFLSKKDKEKMREVDNIEAVAFDSETTMIHSLERANNLASKVALGVSCKKVLYLFFCLCLSLAMMIVSGIISTNFLIFHFGIYFLMSNAIENVVTFFSNSNERKIKKARFLDECDL